MVDKVSWQMNGSLTTGFKDENTTVIGEVSLKNFDSADKETVGIANTALLTKMLNVLDKDVDIKLVRGNGRISALSITDNDSTVNYSLADLVAIPERPKVKALPEFETYLTLNNDIIAKFIKAKNALDDSDAFTIQTVDDESSTIIVGSNETNITNKIKINVPSTGKLPSEISFKSKPMKELLTANKDFDTVECAVSSKGLLRVHFESAQFTSTYYLMAKINTTTQGL